MATEVTPTLATKSAFTHSDVIAAEVVGSQPPVTCFCSTTRHRIPEQLQLQVKWSQYHLLRIVNSRVIVISILGTVVAAKVYLVLFGLVLVLATAYQLTCPDPSQRHFRQSNCTSRGYQYYYCLLYGNEYKESCSKREYTVREGFMKIRMPGITDGNCSEKRYQPITFFASEFTVCMYIKSTCMEEGQVLASNRTGSQDRTCRCDYRAGYSYIIQPRNPCSCIPSEEDCSCMRKYCKNKEELSADYECVPEESLILTVCNKINTMGPPDVKPTIPIQLQPTLWTTTFTEISGVYVSMVIVMILFILIVILLLFTFRVFPDLQSYKLVFDDEHCVISRNDKTHAYTVMEGTGVEVFLTYKSLLSVRKIQIIKVDTDPVQDGKKIWGKKLERDIEFEEHSNDKPKGKLTAVVKQCSLKVPELHSDDTGTYEVTIINRIGASSTLMERWNKLTARVMFFIYPKQDDDREKKCTFKMELIICSIPKKFTNRDVLRGEDIKLDAALVNGNISVKSVHWFRVDDDDQLTIVQTGEKKKYIVDKSNSNLTINQICMSDGGRYFNLLLLNDGQNSSCCWKLKVIPQESAYKGMQDHKSSNDYVRISVVSSAIDYLEKNDVVVLKGREGTGKTKMTLELALKFEENGYLPVQVMSEDDVTDEFDQSKVLYIFDHFDNIQKWKAMLEHFFSKRKSSSSSCKAIFTTKSLDFPELRECKYFKGIKIDFDNGLTKEDKENILKFYLKKNDVAVFPSEESNFKIKEVIMDTNQQIKLDQDSIRIITETEPLQGFPLTAKQFCEDRLNLHFGERFFRTPSKAVIQKLKKMRDDVCRDTDSYHAALRYLALVYITLRDDQKLDTNNIVYKLIIEPKNVLFKTGYENIVMTSNANGKIIEDIKVAANSLVGEYLTCSDSVYEFIHPYYSKAVFLSSSDVACSFIPYCRIEIILEYIRGHDHDSEEETVISIPLIHLESLIKRLASAFIQCSRDSRSRSMASDIGKYIYEFWIKQKDKKFCSILLRHLEMLMYGEEIMEEKIQPWQVLMLMKELTSNWRNLWIYSEDVIQDIVIIFGLIYLFQVKQEINPKLEKKEDKEKENAIKVQELNTIFARFENRTKSNKSDMEEAKIGKKLGVALDSYGNTFFHYLVLFNEKVASSVLDICSKMFKRELTKANERKFRPIDMSVAFGKPELFKKLKKENALTMEGRERLQKILSDARESLHDKGPESTDKCFEVNENFDSEIVRSIIIGSEDDFKALTELLKQK